MKYLKFIFVVSVFIQSCSNDENTLPELEANFTYTDAIDRFELIDSSSYGDAFTYSCAWSSTDNSIAIDNSDSPHAFFLLPERTESSLVEIKLEVFSGNSSDFVIKNIELPKTTEERTYGLGKKLEYEHSNNVDYDWYYDQMGTGPHSGVNCGPTTVTMAIKWADEDFNKTPEDARNTYRSEGGWWYTNDIINYLNQYSVSNSTISVSNINVIKNHIDDGNIIILCLDMFHIRDEDRSKWHIDKFYYTNAVGWGHFIVVKGYKVVDGKTLYEAYDPYSFGNRYNDETIKGKDRYYRSRDLNEAVTSWWSYAIIVSKGNLKSSVIGIDNSKIIHKPGL